MIVSLTYLVLLNFIVIFYLTQYQICLICKKYKNKYDHFKENKEKSKTKTNLLEVKEKK